MIKRSPSAMAFVRMDLGITQQQLADTLGISRAAIAMAERGSRRLPPRASEYLHKLRDIASRMPPPALITRRKRVSVASKRPAYNRVPFSSRLQKPGSVHIVTGKASVPVLSDEELLITGKRLKERMYSNGKQQPTPKDACREILLTLEQKAALTQTRLELVQLDTAVAPERALNIRTQLFLLKAKLKACRQAYKQYPLLRKQHRSIIARLYVKKLYLQDQLEKFNRPAVMKKKQLIAALKEQVEEQRKFGEGMRKRMEGME